MVEISIKRVDPELPLPSYAHPGDAGRRPALRGRPDPRPGERALVPTGIAMALPEGYVALVHPRSGLAARHGISIVNAPGTIDAGYRGEVKVCLVNTDPREPFAVRRGDRIAQLVIQRFETALVRGGRGACRSPRAVPGATVRPVGSARASAQADPDADTDPGGDPGGRDDDVRFGRKSGSEDAGGRSARVRRGVRRGPAQRTLRRVGGRPRGTRLHRPRQPAGHAGGSDGAAAPGRRGQRPGDGRGAGRRGGCARAARLRGVARGGRLGRAASADLRRDGAHGRHGRRAGGHLRHRAAVHGADADPGRPAGHPAEQDRRPRGPGLAAAGHADGPAGRRGRPRRPLGGDDPPGRRTPWARGDAPRCARCR